MAQLDQYQIQGHWIRSAQAISNVDQIKVQTNLAQLSLSTNCWLDHPRSVGFALRYKTKMTEPELIVHLLLFVVVFLSNNVEVKKKRSSLI